MLELLQMGGAKRQLGGEGRERTGRVNLGCIQVPIPRGESDLHVPQTQTNKTKKCKKKESRILICSPGSP